MSRVNLTKIGTPASTAANTSEIFFDTSDNRLKYINESGVVSTVAIQPQISTTLSTPLNPTGTTNTTGVMMGLTNLQSSLVITPKMTGRVHVTINGVVANNTTADGAKWGIRMGTGTAPVNGAALTGTAYGSQESMVFLTGVLKTPFSVTAIITGLTVGTAYWVDIDLAAVTAGTATITSVAVSAFEL